MKTNYTIVKSLHIHSSSQIFQVVDMHGEELIMKCIPKVNGICTPAYLKEIYRREAAALSFLYHERIPQLVDAYITEDQYVLIMKKLPGKSVVFSSKGKSDIERWILQLAKIMKDLHDQHILHLDIKPSNLLVYEHQIYLLDFGSSCKEHTSMGAIAASRLYAPQEVWLRKNVDRRSDIYSFGRCGMMLRHGRILGVHEAKDSWDEVLLKCAAGQPQKRYDDFAQVCAALGQA